MSIKKVGEATSVASGPDGVNVASHAAEAIVRARVAGDGYDRAQLLADGTLLVGNGVVAPVPSGGAAHNTDAAAHTGTLVPVSSGAQSLTKIGTLALNAVGVNGTASIAIGENALKSAVGPFNGYIAIGVNALRDAVPVLGGRFQVAIGQDAALSTTTGYDSVAIGSQSLRANTTGYDNTAVGCYSMYENIVGTHNTAMGESALYRSKANNNVGIGGNALKEATTGGDNVGVGTESGYTATPANALTTGARNTYLGHQAGPGTTLQTNNAIAVGYRALASASFASSLGSAASANGDYSLALGAGAATTAIGSVAIGTNSAGVGASTATVNEIVLGTTAHTLHVPGITKIGNDFRPASTNAIDIGTAALRFRSLYLSGIFDHTGTTFGALGAAPSAKRAATADATDLATVITLANALKADLIAFGFKTA